jgi:hypothetical protein
MKKLKYKLDLSLVLFVIFLTTSIILSFKLSNANKIIHSQNKLDVRISEYRLYLLNEAFLLNYALHGTVVNTKSEIIDEYLNKYKNLAVLYLKQNACSECYNNTISNVIEKLGVKNNFLIISHPSNKQFINEMVETKNKLSKNMIIFSEYNLYSNSSTSHINSVLLIFDYNKQIKLYLSMDLLKDDFFFNEYITFLENNL